MVYDQLTDCFSNILYQSKPVHSSNIASAINDHLYDVTKHIPAIDQSCLNNFRDELPLLTSYYIVEIDKAFTKLRKIKLNKAVGPDGIYDEILRVMAFYLAASLAGIINSSLRQGIVPDQWKISRITPIPKVFPPKDVQSDIRPIAVTNTMAKIAEKFVCEYSNDFCDSHTDI